MACGYRGLWFVIGCVLWLLLLATPGETKVIDMPVHRPGNDSEPQVLQRHLLERARGCFDSGQLLECARGEVIRLVERAIDANVTLRVSPFLTIRRNPEWKRWPVGRGTTIGERDAAAVVGWLGVVHKLREFLLSRVFQFSLVDGQGRWLLVDTDEGRGKKHKHKQGGMFSMALMALMAMIAQVVLGKVAVLAAVALIMAKIALVFSTLVNTLSLVFRALLHPAGQAHPTVGRPAHPSPLGNGLKKSTGAGTGHAAEHVVYEHQGHGGGGGGGWQRSIEPRKPHQRYPTYYDDEDLPYRKRRPEYDYQDALDGA
uniref:Uncharacterized protein n=1 Tax=Anopheles atroparvus TaxID=41427 RepID=A0A182J8T2_ANOAO